MAKFTEIPVFVKGEPGFADKLNQLAAVVAEVIERLDAQGEPAETPKTPTVKPSARKTAASK